MQRHLLPTFVWKTISYGELARQLGNLKASRAVGAANGSTSACCGSLSSGHRSQRKDDRLWWRHPVKHCWRWNR